MKNQADQAEISQQHHNWDLLSAAQEWWQKKTDARTDEVRDCTLADFHCIVIVCRERCSPWGGT